MFSRFAFNSLLSVVLFCVYLVYVQAQYFAPQGEPAICCGKHEANASSYSPCVDRTCEQAIATKSGKIRICPQFILLANYCSCAAGYYYNNCSVCVKFDECYTETKCISDNKFRGSDNCGSSANCTNPCSTPNTEQRCFNSDCERTCDNYSARKTDKCPTSSRECSVGCDCKPGFYRDSNFDCVPADKC